MDTIGRNIVNVMAETSQTNALNTSSSDTLPMMDPDELAEEIKTIQEEEEAVQQAKKSFSKKYDKKSVTKLGT